MKHKPDQPSANGILPKHIAIIMDGNGRWARERGLRRVKGHEEGINSVREVTETCSAMKIRQLTLYAFSAENWKRPKTEVFYLMSLLERYLIHERPTIMKDNIRFTAIGRLNKLPAGVRRELKNTSEVSARNTGMVMCLALNYGGRTEIADAARSLAKAVDAGELNPSRITPRVFAKHLYDPQMSDPDLLIRTAGEMRWSNFLLWQASYAEFFVSNVFWPDFREPQLMEAIEAYRQRERRFGGLSRKP